MKTYSVILGQAPATLVSQRVPRGTTYKLTIRVLDENQDPKNLTGASVVVAVKATPETDAFLIRKRLDGTGASDFPNGIVVLELTPADTEMVGAGWYYWGAVVNLVGGETYELGRGDFSIYENVASAPIN